MNVKDEINRIYNEFLNSKKHLVDCMELVRKWESDGFNSYEDALSYYLDTPDHYIEVVGVRHPIRGLRGLAALLLYFCMVEGIEGVTFVECENFIRDLFVRAPQTANETESLAIQFLKREMGFASARLAPEKIHSKYSVDVEVPGVMGVQVKPISYKFKMNKEPEHISFKRDREGFARWKKDTGLPLFLLYYKGIDPFIDWTFEEWKE